MDTEVKTRAMTRLIPILLLTGWMFGQVASPSINKPDCDPQGHHCVVASINKVCRNKAGEPIPCYQPLDVPATSELRFMRDVQPDICKMLAENHDPTFMADSKANCNKQFSFMTCAKKSRILEHDEQTPPKYWCRKVQP